MAKRYTLTHDAETRKKIQTTQIINRLTKHFNSEVELSQTQVKTAEILLKKSLPDLSAIEISGDENNPLKSDITITWKSK